MYSFDSSGERYIDESNEANAMMRAGGLLDDDTDYFDDDFDEQGKKIYIGDIKG